MGSVQLSSDVRFGTVGYNQAVAKACGFGGLLQAMTAIGEHKQGSASAQMRWELGL